MHNILTKKAWEKYRNNKIVSKDRSQHARRCRVPERSWEPWELETLQAWSTATATTTKPFVPSIWGRLHEPKENYDGLGTWISFLHSFLSSNIPSLRP